MSLTPVQAPSASAQRPIKLRPVHEKFGLTIKQFHDCGWNNEQLVEHGYAEWIVPAEEPVECLLCEGSGHKKPDQISDVTRQLIARDLHGREKYGVTLDRTDLSLTDWLQHQAEELMDGAGYALAAKREAEQLTVIKLSAGVLCELVAKHRDDIKMASETRVQLYSLAKLLGVTI